MPIVFEKRGRTDPGARRVAGPGVKISPWGAERWHTGYQREEAGGCDLRGMEDPANGIVHEFALRECLVSALVSDDPQACHPKPSEERVKRPEREPCEIVQPWVRELDELGGNTRV